jgi:hypothetical protein
MTIPRSEAYEKELGPAPERIETDESLDFGRTYDQKKRYHILNLGEVPEGEDRSTFERSLESGGLRGLKGYIIGVTGGRIVAHGTRDFAVGAITAEAKINGSQYFLIRVPDHPKVD